MIGELFTINAINVALASVQKVERGLRLDVPVDVRVGSHDPHGVDRLYVSVSSPDRPTRTIDVDDEAVRACLEQEGPGTTHWLVSELVDGLAREITAAVREVLRA